MTVANLDELKAFPAWLRLEPRCRSNDFARGLQARTADPLWMLARQWQTGEFQGEDAGSPLEVRLKYATQSLDRVRLGETEEIDLSGEPFEKVVEQEWPALDAWKRVQMGQQFERFLLSELKRDAQADLPSIIKAYRDHYPLLLPAGTDWISTDLATRRFLEFMRGRVVDGAGLLDHIDFSDHPNHRVPLKGSVQREQLDRILQDFKVWCDRLNIRPSGENRRPGGESNWTIASRSTHRQRRQSISCTWLLPVIAAETSTGIRSTTPAYLPNRNGTRNGTRQGSR